MPTVSTFDISGGYRVSGEDFEYARPDGEPLLARVYRPAGRGPFAALVDLHGGAWSSFDRTVDAYFDSALAACGMQADVCIAAMRHFIARRLAA